MVGAGLAGLAAALRLVELGVGVTLIEAGPAAGGRCRSYFDRELGCRIDNGNHLLLSGNRAAFGFMDQVGSRDTLAGPGRPAFPFMDLASGERWTVRPNMGRVPWWLLSPDRRVKGTRLADYAQLLRLRRAGPEATVAQTLPQGALYRRLLEPFAIAALNTMPEAGSARLLWAVIEESLAQGGHACIPAYPREGLSETFVDPALRWLEARGAEIRLSRRVSEIGRTGGRVTALDGEEVDAVVLAVPAPVASALVPGVEGPTEFESIVNVHFRVEAEPGDAGFVGLVGGLAEWVFVKPGVVSTTISAGNRFAERESVVLAQQVWQEVRTVLHLTGPIPTFRVLREKRATFAATPEQDRRRPRPMANGNLALAGDWTATGLPATIEGAIRSGRQAAESIVGSEHASHNDNA